MITDDVTNERVDEEEEVNEVGSKEGDVDQVVLLQ
jgi:hypothetical protein